MRTIKHIAGLFFLIIAANAYSQPNGAKENWILISSDGKREIYYDSASVHVKSADNIRAWVKFVYSSPRTVQGYDKPVKHSVVLFRFDCGGNRFMYDKTYLYFVDNSEESYEHFLTWKYAEKGTASEVILNRLCAGK
jgi:hypothetical protein